MLMCPLHFSLFCFVLNWVFVGVPSLPHLCGILVGRCPQLFCPGTAARHAQAIEGQFILDCFQDEPDPAHFGPLLLTNSSSRLQRRNNSEATTHKRVEATSRL